MYLHSNKIPSMVTFVFTNVNSLDPSPNPWEQCPIDSHFTGDKTEALVIKGKGEGELGQNAGCL